MSFSRVRFVRCEGCSEEFAVFGDAVECVCEDCQRRALRAETLRIVYGTEAIGSNILGECGHDPQCINRLF